MCVLGFLFLWESADIGCWKAVFGFRCATFFVPAFAFSEISYSVRERR